MIYFVGLKLLIFFAVVTSTANRDDRDRGRGPSRSKFGPLSYLWIGQENKKNILQEYF